MSDIFYAQQDESFCWCKYWQECKEFSEEENICTTCKSKLRLACSEYHYKKCLKK